MNQTLPFKQTIISNSKIYDCKLTRKIEWGGEDRVRVTEPVLSQSIRSSFRFLSVYYYLQIDNNGNIMHK